MASEKIIHGEDLALFAAPSFNAAIERVQWVDYQPTSHLRDQSPVEFTIPASGAQYISLNRSYLFLKIQILRGDGTSLSSPSPSTTKKSSDSKEEDESEKVGIINIPFDSIWSQVDVYLQQKLVSNSGTNFAYKAIIETLLNYGEEAKNSQLQARGFYKDTSSTIDTAAPVAGGNAGLATRYGLLAESKTGDFMGTLRCDICQQDRLILNGVEVQIKLWPCKPAFALMTAGDNPDYKINIVDAVFKVCKVTLNPELTLIHSERLKKQPANYIFDKTQIKAFTISKGEYSFRFDDIFSGDIPNFVVVGMVTSKAYSGDYTANPFNFIHKNISSLGVFIDDESLPTRPLKVNFSQKNFIESYHNLFTALGILGRDKGINISRDEYNRGYTLFSFNLKPDNLPSFSKRGNLKIEGMFENALDENVTLIIYATFPFLLQIDSARNVLM